MSNITDRLIGRQLRFFTQDRTGIVSLVMKSLFMQKERDQYLAVHHHLYLQMLSPGLAIANVKADAAFLSLG
jgi:hypothetical protein